jgi:outer membrane protein assembly factor BamB
MSEEGLEADALARLQQHMETCTYCQAQRHSYEQLEAELFRQFGPAAVPRLSLADILQGFQDELPEAAQAASASGGEEGENNTENMDGYPLSPSERQSAHRRTPPLERRDRMNNPFTLGKRWAAIHRLSALAAVLLLTVLVGSLIAGLVLVRHEKSTSGSPTATALPSTATPAPLPPAIYLSGYNKVYKVDMQTGTIIWTYQLEPKLKDSIEGRPVLAGNEVYFGTYKFYVYALNASDGSLLWHSKIPENQFYGAMPTIADGVIYVGGTISGTVYALKATDGTLLWHARVPLPPNAFDQYVQVGDVAVAKGTLYVSGIPNTSPDEPPATGVYSYLYALNARDGDSLWSIPAPGEQLFSEPEILDGVLYLSSHNIKHKGLVDTQDSSLYAYNPDNGTLLWRFQVKEFAVTSQPTIANGVIYFGTASGSVYALDAAHGTLLWSTSLAGVAETDFPSTQIENGVLYLAGAKTAHQGPDALLALNTQDGSVRWRYENNKLSPWDFVARGQVLFLAEASSGTLYALNTQDGSMIWKTQYDTSFGGLPDNWVTVAP